MVLSLKEIRTQLRLEEDFTEEDILLTAIGKAAQARTENFLNRKIYSPESEIPDSDADGLLLTDDLRLAMLMLVSHFYEHRSSVSDFEQTATPMAYEWIVRPYRFIPL
ncbi:head-tail connector protein [Erwinia rhapontici]|uniref:head-tail connector protein n=1 Tax=Erwinia rhapontici TaxID=55212 RepID=UPI00216751C2|nr:head-tail connector protein [Erwinia rhapontici]MCS3605320.1 hypothetical protein [Erwinia rhapontici]